MVHHTARRADAPPLPQGLHLDTNGRPFRYATFILRRHQAVTPRAAARNGSRNSTREKLMTLQHGEAEAEERQLRWRAWWSGARAPEARRSTTSGRRRSSLRSVARIDLGDQLSKSYHQATSQSHHRRGCWTRRPTTVARAKLLSACCDGDITADRAA